MALALFRAAFNAGSSIPASIAMIATTTSSSINVKFPFRQQVPHRGLTDGVTLSKLHFSRISASHPFESFTIDFLLIQYSPWFF
jgi:hypothetical protein